MLSFFAEQLKCVYLEGAHAEGEAATPASPNGFAPTYVSQLINQHRNAHRCMHQGAGTPTRTKVMHDHFSQHASRCAHSQLHRL